MFFRWERRIKKDGSTAMSLRLVESVWLPNKKSPTPRAILNFGSIAQEDLCHPIACISFWYNVHLKLDTIALPKSTRAKLVRQLQQEVPLPDSINLKLLKSVSPDLSKLLTKENDDN